MARGLAPDRYLFAMVVVLVATGLLMIYSASAMQIYSPSSGGPEDPNHFLFKQSLALIVGAAMAFAVHAIDYRELNRISIAAAGMTSVVILLIGALLSKPINGTHRWINLGKFSLQPSEFAKIAVVIAIAALLSRREGEVESPFRTLLPSAGIVALPVLLVLAQPDFGTALSYFAITGVMLFVAGLRFRWFLGSALILLPPLAGYMWSASYRRDRILAFLNVEADPLGKGFHAIQSLIAVGTGGWHGLGLGSGKQKLFFLPYPHTDFIYAIVGEELGLIGCVAVLAVFGVLFARGLRAAVHAPDSFGRLVAVGLSAMIMFQALLNISVVLVLVPTKGIPLPFISYGGSALWADLIAVGILLNISQHAP